MGPFSLHSLPAVGRLPASPTPRRAAMERFSSQPSTFPTTNTSSSRRYPGPDAGNVVFISSRPLASSGSLQGATGTNPKKAESIEQEINFKDNDLVFVAGATGRVGSRTVRELLRLGFRVRAGVRSAPRAETLVQSVKQMNLDDAVGNAGTQPAERLEIVECDLENQDGIGPAIGSASIVICCIGASEKEVFDVTGPYRIDFRATKNLIEAATLAKINHFILLTSLGTNKIGFPAAILNLFWGVLIWKRKAEEALIASGLPYTIVRPGGMERPTDSYKETHNIILANEDIYFGGQVSNLQVAELMAFMARNRRISQYKVVEVIAETTAPLTPMEVLLAKIPPQRKLQAESSQDPVPPSIESKPTKPIAEEESKQVEVMKERPLSPYAMYDDLKPPTSPTPTPSTTPASPKEKQAELQAKTVPQTTSETSSSLSTEAVNEKGKIQVPPQKPWSLSPYTAYEDLKPPTSPTPTPASTSAKERLVNAKPPPESKTGDGAAGTTTISINEHKISKIPSQTSDHLSPYHAYDEFKPPTPPSPNASITSVSKPVTDDASADESRGEEPNKQEKPRPLSPFTMYDDLKPPTSPVPSVPKH